MSAKLLTNCVIVGKRPLISQLSAEESSCLQEAVPDRWREINAAANAHNQTLKSVINHMQHRCEQIRVLRVDELADEYWLPESVELVVTVGGDGTVLATHPHSHNVPILSINSDPTRSTGWLTTARPDSWQDLLLHWLDNKAAYQQALPRLQAGLDTAARPQPFLNDCLLTNSNPAALSRYVLRIGEKQESQSSSGIWLSTATGATGAISSANTNQDSSPKALPPTSPQILYRVREPLQRRRRYSLLAGDVSATTPCTIRSLQAGLTGYLDGAHRQIGIPAGRELQITPAPEPLLLVGALPATVSDHAATIP